MKPIKIALAIASAVTVVTTGYASAGGNYNGASSMTWKACGFTSMSPKYESSDEYKFVGTPFVFPPF